MDRLWVARRKAVLGEVCGRPAAQESLRPPQTRAADERRVLGGVAQTSRASGPRRSRGAWSRHDPQRGLAFPVIWDELVLAHGLFDPPHLHGVPYWCGPANARWVRKCSLSRATRSADMRTASIVATSVCRTSEGSSTWTPGTPLSTKAENLVPAGWRVRLSISPAEALEGLRAGRATQSGRERPSARRSVRQRSGTHRRR